MDGPTISVIIPTLNEEENLHGCIKSISNQTNTNFEVIIADGGSVDHTIDIGLKNGFNILDVEKNRPHDVSTAKNLGAKHAVGDILFFLDADMVLEPNCFEVIFNEYKNTDIVGVSLKVLPKEANLIEKAMYQCNNYLARLGNTLGLHEISYFSCHSYRKETFMEVGGFRLDLLACEDLDLSLRLRHFGRYKVTSKSTIWTSPRRLREWTKTGYVYKYVKYLTEYYIKDKVSEFYDDLN